MSLLPITGMTPLAYVVKLSWYCQETVQTFRAWYSGGSPSLKSNSHLYAAGLTHDAVDADAKVVCRLFQRERIFATQILGLFHTRFTPPSQRVGCITYYASELLFDSVSTRHGIIFQRRCQYYYTSFFVSIISKNLVLHFSLIVIQYSQTQ